MTLAGLHYSEIWTNIGRAACETCCATWDLGANSAFALGSRKTTEKLDRVGRSQDLPDANWLLASSPALNTWTLTLVPNWLWIHRQTHRLSFDKTWTPKKMTRPTILSLCIFVATEMCLPSRCLAPNRGTHLTEPLPCNDRRDTHTDTQINGRDFMKYSV
jgi:hypothetical protein